MTPASQTAPSPTLILEQSWTDLYGGTLSRFSGRHGGGDLLVACPLESAQLMLDQLLGLPRFRGNLTLAVWEQRWQVALERSIQDLEPALVLCVAGRDPQAGVVQAPTGLTFEEEGSGWGALKPSSAVVLHATPQRLLETLVAELEQRGWR